MICVYFCKQTHAFCKISCKSCESEKLLCNFFSINSHDSGSRMDLSRSGSSYVHGVYKSSDVCKTCFSSPHMSRNLRDEKSPGAIWLSWKYQECPGETMRWKRFTRSTDSVCYQRAAEPVKNPFPRRQPRY